MTTASMPGFTADNSLGATTARYRAITGQYGTGRQRVIGQARIGPGGGFGGFWECVACVAICSIFFDVVECYDACKNSGACEVVAIAR